MPVCADQHLLCVIFTSGTNRPHWEQQAPSKTYTTKSTIGSCSKKKKRWLADYNTQCSSWELYKWKRDGNFHMQYTNTWGQEEDGRAAEKSIYHQKYPLPSGAQSVVCIRCPQKRNTDQKPICLRKSEWRLYSDVARAVIPVKYFFLFQFHASLSFVLSKQKEKRKKKKIPL